MKIMMMTMMRGKQVKSDEGVFFFFLELLSIKSLLPGEVFQNSSLIYYRISISLL